MIPSIPELATNLQKLFIEDAEQLGRESGFIQRERKLNGASFAQAIIFGWQANPKASLDELRQSASLCGVKISPQGLQERLNSPQATEFLKRLLMKGLEYVVRAEGKRDDLLSQFTGVYIQDSSKIELPKALVKEWRGNGLGQSTLKIQVGYDYQCGQLDIRLAEGRQHDCSLQNTDLRVGSLRLADLAYFKVKVFQQLDSDGVYWLSRLPARVGIWTGEQVTSISAWLAQQQTDRVDQYVELTAQRLHCRLVAIRVPPDVAATRRKRVCEAAKSRKLSQLQENTLALCDWTILVTNLTSQQASLDEAIRLLRLRWQIELLFKLWKQHLLVDEWRSAQPFQILSEIYAKLLLALIQHWLLILGCWDMDDRSLVKACLLLRKLAFHFLSALPDFSTLSHTLTSALPALADCRLQKRKTRPATFQLLDRAFSLS